MGRTMTTVLISFIVGLSLVEARFLEGRYRRALPPPYLSVEGHRQCLANFQASDSHRELCLPLRPLTQCPATTWEELQAVLSEGKPVKKKISRRGDGRPEYLDIEGFRFCLKDYQASETHTELCKPFQKPEECPEAAWTALANAFDGATCPPPLIGGLAGLPPAYLTVNGYQDCLLKQAASESHEGLCLPDAKPDDCEDTSFEELKNVFQGPKCQAGKARQARQGQPAYLSVPGFKDCLSEYQKPGASYTERCLPKEKPSQCPDGSWNQMLKFFTGEKCLEKAPQRIGLGAPAYLQVPNFRKCLGEHQKPEATHTELCLLSTKPEDCPQGSWDQIITVFVGDKCNNEEGRQSRSAQLGPPAYLQVQDYQLCLGEHQKPGDSHTELCKLSSKPDPCAQSSWDKLLEVFEGDNCLEDGNSTRKARSGAPAYLSVAGFQDCLSEHQKPGQGHIERCLPASKPEACLQESWDKLQTVFDGDKCLPDARKSRQLPGVGAPAYLKVPDFDKCLGEHKKPNDTHTERCLPTIKPGDCPTESWNEMVEVFTGDKCLSRKSKSLTLTIPQPAFLSVPGHEACLGTYPISATMTERCLPIDKPTACTDAAWEALEINFEGIRCPKSTAKAPTGVPPPYLAVEGHEDCLEEHQASPTHTERCLPQNQPFICSDEAWEQLENVFEGIRCPVAVAGREAGRPPQYLFVVGFEKCLDVHKPTLSHSEYCLPQTKPESCDPSSWSELLKFFEGIRCGTPIIEDVSAHPPSIPPREGSVAGPGAAPGAVGALPPAHLAVEGHQTCLGRQPAALGSHIEVCLPFNKPEECTDDAWIKLNNIFVGNKCNREEGPPPYTLIEGHEDCMDVHQPTADHAEKCLPQFKPGPCNEAAWRELNQAFSGIRCATGSRPVAVAGSANTPGSASQPDYLAVDGQQNCLGYHQIDDDHTVKCIPHEQPAGCEDAAWQQLLNVFVGIGCAKEVIEEPTVGAPAYLSIDGHQFCLGTYRASETHTEKCLPREKLPDCDDEAWTKLQQVFTGIKCPAARPANDAPVVANIEQEEITFPNAQPLPTGYLTCISEQLVTDIRIEKCLPAVKPEACSEITWAELEAEFTGPKCRRQPNVLPPHYLLNDDYKKCLVYNEDGEAGKKYCLSKSQPNDCPIDVWESLQIAYDGDNCREGRAAPFGALPPPYLSIQGHAACLKAFQATESHEEQCLPLTKPDGCSQEAFDALLALAFEAQLPRGDRQLGGDLPPPLIGGVGALPPAWLSVTGHQECLSSHQASDTHTAVCIPKTKPDNCSDDAWTKLEQVFQGDKCRGGRQDDHVKFPSRRPSTPQKVDVVHRPGEIELPLVYCNTDGDCLSGDAERICNLFFLPITDKVGATYDGICVPTNCDALGRCPNVGTVETGAISGRCKRTPNLCEYDQAFIKA